MSHLPMIIFVIGVALAFFGLGGLCGVGVGQRMEWARSQEAEHQEHAAVALPMTHAPLTRETLADRARRQRHGGVFNAGLAGLATAPPDLLAERGWTVAAVREEAMRAIEPVKIDRTQRTARHAAEPDDALSTTGEFWLIVAPLLVDLGVPVDPLALPCTRCAGVGATHEDCPGCACPCTLAAVAP